MFENKHIIPLIRHVTTKAAEEPTNHQTKTKQNKTKQNKTKQNKTKQNKTKQNKTKQNKTKQNKTMSVLPSGMGEACRKGNVQVVKEFLSSHPESITWSNPVSDFGFVNDDVVFIVISFIVNVFVLTVSMDPLTGCLSVWPQRCCFSIVGPQCECGGSGECK